MVQCGAVWCSVVQSVAECCSICCSVPWMMLSFVAVHYSALQCAAMCCSEPGIIMSPILDARHTHFEFVHTQHTIIHA